MADLPPELWDVHIADHLPRNDLAVLRRVSKLFRSLFNQHRLISTAEPVNTVDFAEKWARWRAVHALSYDERVQLVCATARSGVLENLQLLVGSPEVASCRRPGTGRGFDMWTFLTICKHRHECALLPQPANIATDAPQLKISVVYGLAFGECGIWRVREGAAVPGGADPAPFPGTLESALDCVLPSSEAHLTMAFSARLQARSSACSA